MLAYVTLLRLFVHGAIAAPDFETLYLYMFKNDPTHRAENVYQILEDLFADVDAYCADPDLRSVGDLDDQQLLREAQTALATLEQIASVES